MESPRSSFTRRNSDAAGSSGDKIQVAVRIRPMNDLETRLNNSTIWTCRSPVIEELEDDGRSSGKRYRFDNVFGPETCNADVYERQCKKIAEGAIEGYNGTIFAYGQTGSGKTFTVMGDPDTNPGICRLAIDEIFGAAKSRDNMQWDVRVSFVEIYNETITDLLQADAHKAPHLKIVEHKSFGPELPDAVEIKVTSPHEAIAAFKQGDQRRSIAATNMNAKSSRSHSLFRLRIESTGDGKSTEEAADNMRSVAQTFMNTQRDLTADRASLYLVDSASQELFIQAGEITLRLPLSQGIAGACATKLQTINIPDVYEDDRFHREIDQRSGYRTKSMLCVPILGPTGVAVGVVQFINKKTGEQFDDADERLVEEMNANIAPLIVKAQAGAAFRTMSVLNLVDLAGSERLSKSGAQGTALKEAGFINKSLMMLGTCISLLAEGKKGVHIPFRDSKLTRLLSTSLGGNTRTCLLCAVSPAARNRSESQSTLQFATRAKKITTHATQNRRVDASELCSVYEAEIERLKAQLLEARRHSSCSDIPNLGSVTGHGGTGHEGSESSDDEASHDLHELKALAAEALELVNQLSPNSSNHLELNVMLAKRQGQHKAVVEATITSISSETPHSELLTEENLVSRVALLRQLQDLGYGGNMNVWTAVRLQALKAEVDDARSDLKKGLLSLAENTDGASPLAGQRDSQHRGLVLLTDFLSSTENRNRDQGSPSPVESDSAFSVKSLSQRLANLKKLYPSPEQESAHSLLHADIVPPLSLQSTPLTDARPAEVESRAPAREQELKLVDAETTQHGSLAATSPSIPAWASQKLAPPASPCYIGTTYRPGLGGEVSPMLEMRRWEHLSRRPASRPSSPVLMSSSRGLAVPGSPRSPAAAVHATPRLPATRGLMMHSRSSAVLVPPVPAFMDPSHSLAMPAAQRLHGQSSPCLTVAPVMRPASPRQSFPMQSFMPASPRLSPRLSLPGHLAGVSSALGPAAYPALAQPVALPGHQVRPPPRGSMVLQVPSPSPVCASSWFQR
eukprot:TRINITY_DN47646_c0_g1_i1.p1 TRINITY_DN47646_c0_g1~~TRINITY_DN47646_c0_g1_i1.p1  ORF type:complete len:1024 (+),score=164.88 TRINITY_DN47646_c0_g1_i1:21-3092(+)